ncbi:MAG: RHS repeat-associated core domain-containing protein, partial [Kiloniellales bacterium]|nr:RHS repeat-associated core domain-containing protein [Kiloniellales bacterium]
AALGAGAQSGDIVVQVTGASGWGAATQAVAFTAAGVDQAATPLLSQASSPGTAETAIAASITTGAKSLLVSAFGLGDQATWAPGAGETQAGYAGSGSAAGGASTEVAGPGTADMSWSGPAPPGRRRRQRRRRGRALRLRPPRRGPGRGGLGSIAFRYAGQRYDAETKLIYMRARYYSVAIGRFLSPDPIGYEDGFNLYTYAANSPLNFIDPTGLLAARSFIFDGRSLRETDYLQRTPTFLERTANFIARNEEKIVVGVRVGIAAGALLADLLTVPSGEGLAGAAAARSLGRRLIDWLLGKDQVIYNNGWQTRDGRFASPRSSGQTTYQFAERLPWDSIAQKPGWSVIRGRVYARNSAGDIRIYDGVAVSPRGRVIGLEIKTGLSRNSRQLGFDRGINTQNPASAFGENTGLVIGRAFHIKL